MAKFTTYHPPDMIQKSYTEQTPEDYLQRMSPEVLTTLTQEQRSEILRLLQAAIPKPSPKIIDLRVLLDLIVTRYYLVLWVGKDRRKSPRRYRIAPFTQVANFAAACIILLALNLTVTASLFLSAYLVKSAAGIDLMPGHIGDYLPGK